MIKFRLILFVFILSLTACQEQMEKLSDEATSEFITAKDRLWMIKEIQGGVNTKAVADISKTWQSGDTIRIKFLNGTETLQNRVKQYASIWLEYADLVFEYVENDADVKISFDWEGKLVSWSTIGTDCQLVPQNESSLNFVYLDDPDEEFVRGEVLRAFGHVLGLGFEHKNPSSPLVFKANAAATLQDYYGLTEEEVNDFMAQYQTDQTNYSDYDKSSIMVAEIPGSILVNRRLASLFNTELSVNDIAFISDLYPPKKTQEIFDFILLVDNVSPTRNCFFIDDSKENMYYLQQYSSNSQSLKKINIKTGTTTTLFNFNGFVYDFVVDSKENIYVNISDDFDMSNDGVWIYDKSGIRLQQVYKPDGSPLESNNLVGIDCNGLLYSSYTPEVPPLTSTDITYIFRFDSESLSSFNIAKIVNEKKSYASGIFNIRMVKDGMLFRNNWNNKGEFYFLDTPMGETLLKKKFNSGLISDDFAFITDRGSDVVYLLLMHFENNVVVRNTLNRYNVNTNDVQYIGDLPTKVTEVNGSVSKNLCISGGEVLNEKELVLYGTVGEGENTFIVKLNILATN